MQEQAFSAFMCHPSLYHARHGDPFTALDGRKHGSVLTVQQHHSRKEHYPNKATAWVTAHGGTLCAVNLAVHDGEHLRVIDMLTRDPGTSPLEQDPRAYTAVCIFFSDGHKKMYRQAVRFMKETKRTCAALYHFQPKFMLLHVTATGMLRRKMC
eukprot:3613684-Rhodomonas_salina.1